MHRLTVPATCVAIAAVAAAAATAATAIEQPPVLRASQILPAELLAGPNHRVGERVVTDGYMNHYTISSRFGDLKANSTAELGIRVNELNAIAKMQSISDARQLQSGIEASADSMVSGVGNFLVDPVAGVQGTVSGVNKLFGRANASLRGEKDQDDLLGFDKAKRAVAAEFGVDPYSSNAMLQAELDRLAKAKQTGSLALSGALAPVGGGAGIALSATSATVKLNELLRDRSVAELKAINAERLAAMGVGADVIDLFLAAPELSPTQQTAIVKLLERMDSAADRPLVVKQAILTSSEDVARFRVRQLAMYLAHHENTSPIKRFVPAEKYVVAAIDARGHLLTAMPVDHLSWTSDVAAISEATVNEFADLGELSDPTLMLTGTATPAARSAVESLGWRLTENFSIDGI